MSLRKAINAKCRECTYDPKGAGSAAQQIATCVVKQCPLYPVRPITAKKIPQYLLDLYKIDLQDLDERSRGIVTADSVTAGDGQIEPLQTNLKHIEILAKDSKAHV